MPNILKFSGYSVLYLYSNSYRYRGVYAMIRIKKVAPDNTNKKEDTDMIEEIAEVIRVERGYAHVRPLSSSTCKSCTSHSGCSSLAFFTPKQKVDTIIKVQNPVYARPGDQVIIGVSSGALVSNSLLTYFLPVLTLLFCAVLGSELFSLLSLNTEIGSIIFGFIGLVAGFYGSRVATSQTALCNSLDVLILRIKQQELHPIRVDFGI